MNSLLRIFREPINSITHLAGGVLALFGFVLLLFKTSFSNPWAVTAVFLFGLSLTGLFFSSGIYHWVKSSETLIQRLRKLDHMMIYILIAGTYTPFALLAMPESTGFWVFVGVWTVAAFGVLKKLFWMTAPRWFSTALYLGMGWASVFVLPEVYRMVGAGALVLIALGGVCYSVGAVIYAMKKPTLIPNWLGFHEIWHLFVMGGSTFHFLAVYWYVPL